MESFKHKGKEVRFWNITGEVIGQNKYSETHVSSSGGGGYVGKHGGFVNAAQVNSTVVTNHEFWIKKDDGKEESVQLYGADVPLREGHRITLIGARRSDEDHGPWSMLINHTEGKHRFLTSARALNKRMRLHVFRGVSILTVPAIFFGCLYALHEFNNRRNFDDTLSASLSIAGIYLFIHLVIKYSRISDMEQKLSRHMESLAQETYKKQTSN